VRRQHLAAVSYQRDGPKRARVTDSEGVR